MFLLFKDPLSFVLENMQPTNTEDWGKKKKFKMLAYTLVFWFECILENKL